MTSELRQEIPTRAGSLAIVRALARLVERLSAESAANSGSHSTSITERRDAVRDALRGLAGATRGGALHCFVDEQGMHVNDVLILPAELRAEPPLYGFARRIVTHEVGTLTIRQGAAPGELLTLGRMLAEAPQKPVVAPAPSATDELMVSSRTPTEVLRSWSVLVTPASSPRLTEDAIAPGVGSTIARLRSAKTDHAARHAISELLEQVGDAEIRQDASTIESIASAVLHHTRSIGAGEGRLASEGGLRRMLREGVVTLLASRIPFSNDRDTLISILARTGEMGGRALVNQLMAAEDRPARRSYFDAIITQDSGIAQLREALNDSRWYVVRNAAALLGEMGMTDADASLIPLLAHLDERIRIAAARALSRLRTARGLAALQLRLSDPNAEVRRLAAAAFGLSASLDGAPRPHSAQLAAALSSEAEEDVTLEMLASLGKLASADAVQRLIRLAMGGVEASSSPAWFRVAALEALVGARGTSSVPTLEVLATDGDEEVATAARRLLGNVLSG